MSALRGTRAGRSHAASLALPVIHAGDRLIVEEHTAVAEAGWRLWRWDSAAVGRPLRVRLEIGGKVLRAVALGPGRAAFWPERRLAMRACVTGRRLPLVAGCCSLCVARMPAHAGQEAQAAAAGSQATPPEEALHAYVERVRAQQAAEVRTPGSIWSPEGRLVRLGTDAKAVRLARCGLDRGHGEPGRLDRRPGEELPSLECQLGSDLAVRQA